MVGRKKYTTISVPYEVRDTVKSLATARKVAQWRVIHEAVMHYRLAYLSHFTTNTGWLNKAAWYAYKLSASIGEFRADPSEEKKGMLLRTIDQIEARLGVDCAALRYAVEAYAKSPSRKNRVVLNDAAKEVVGQIITALARKESQKDKKEKEES